MSNSLIIGQYVPGQSLVHRLDPRTKITIIFFYVFIVFFANSFWSYTILTLFSLSSMLTTKIHISFILIGLTSIIFLYVFFVFFSNSFWSYTILTLFALASMLTTKIPLRFILKGLTPVWFLIIFTFILHLIVTKEGTVVVELFTFKVYSGGLIQGFAISMRFFLLILVTSLLTLTTTPIEITDAIEDMLHPLKKVKFPVHELALMMSISL